MLVIDKAKALALKLDHPQRVLSTIPTAQQITIRGTDIVVVPHKHDEVRVLRNLGIKAPAPMLHYYDWVGHHTPYQHQILTSAFLSMNQKGLVLNEIGTGKTNSALWAADYLMNEGIVKKVLIISPLSTLERVWGDTIFTEFVHRSAVTLTGPAERRLQRLAQDVNFYIINHDGFSIISDAAMDMFDLVIVDEAAVYRNATTTRFRVLRRWIDAQPNLRVWLMTGTPTPNAPTDAWALSKMVDSIYSTKTFTAFRDQVMMKLGRWNFVPRPNCVDTVRYVLQPAVRFTRDECFDLPSTVVQTRQVELSTEQRKYYSRMIRDLLIDFTKEKAAGVQMTAVNEAVKLQKLVQIACGVAYDDQKNHIRLDCQSRVDVVREIIEEAGGKVIVFVPLTGTLHMLRDKLSRRWEVAIVNGSVSPTKRNKIFHDFQKEEDPYVLIAHPATMAHGLTLTAASTIIWYGPVTSNEQYTQANGRIERIGKHHTSNVVHVVSTDLEYKMYERLKNKQRLQGVLLELIQSGTVRENL